MELKIHNLAKIKDAAIKLDGITVIAGQNNSGKSTVGKTLYAVVKSVSNVENIITKQQCASIANVSVRNILQYDGLNENKRQLASTVSLINLIISQLDKMAKLDVDTILKLIVDICVEVLNLDIVSDDAKFKNLRHDIDEILAVSRLEIEFKYIDNVFNDIFYGQLNSLYNESKAHVVLANDMHSVELSFDKEKCTSVARNMQLYTNIFYINNPFVIDDISQFNMQKHSYIRSLTNKFVNKNSIGLTEEVINDKKLKVVLDKIEQLVPGQFRQDGSEIVLQQKTLRKPLKLVNLSAGVKSFAIIKRLIENGWVNDQDMFVLDEPEIHAHPEWQLIYAEILVLLTKMLGIKILLTTHSPYFLNALEVYSYKYGLKDKVHYYLSAYDNGIIFEDITNCLDKAYVKLAEPFDCLEKLRSELGMED